MDECYTLDNDPDFSNSNRLYDSMLRRLELEKINKVINLNLLHNISSTRYFTTFGNYRKGYLRIKLPNLDSDTIDNAIKEFSNLEIIFGNSNKQTIFCINILLNLYLCTLVGQKVETIDVEQFLSQHTDEEINSLIYRKENDKEIYNSKYIFTDKKAFYLDIPLCDDFYCNHEDYFGDKIVTIERLDQYHYVAVNDYSFTIEFEENIFLHHGYIYRPTARHIFATSLIKSYISINNKSTHVAINNCKYGFIVIDKTEFANELLNVKLCVYYKGIKKFDIKLEHMIVMNCLDKIIYGFSPKENSDMNEFYIDNNKCSDESYIYHNDGTNIYNITLTFTTITEPVKFQIIYIADVTTFY
jgi:hypothetical protein